MESELREEGRETEGRGIKDRGNECKGLGRQCHREEVSLLERELYRRHPHWPQAKVRWIALRMLGVIDR